MRVFFINLKKNFISYIFLLFTICLIMFSKSNIVAVKNGLTLWINNIIPSLFPFFIAVELLNYTNIPQIIGNCFKKIMKPFFHVPGIGAYALFMGVISGYPVGAKIVTDLRNKKLCTKEEGERLLTFTNNSGPLFIISSVGITLFNDTSIGLLLLTTHLLACFTVAIIFRYWKCNRGDSIEITDNAFTNVNLGNLGGILSKSILNAIHSTIIIRWFYNFI